MADTTFFEAMLEHDPATCWAYVGEDRVCILQRPCSVHGASGTAVPTMRHSFTDPITQTNVTLVIPPGGVVFPAPGEPKIGVEHQGCPERADLALQYDAFYCPRCRWSGRIVGAWAVEMIEAAPVTPSRTDRQPPTSPSETKGGQGTDGPDA